MVHTEIRSDRPICGPAHEEKERGRVLRPLPPTVDHLVTLCGAGGLITLPVGERKWRFAIPLGDSADRNHMIHDIRTHEADDWICAD